jgi:hypothetical protein
VTLTPTVNRAIDELRSDFGAEALEVRADGEGGAYVIISGIELGPPYVQADSWVGFRVTYNYPYADVYPHYVRGDLSRIDGTPLGAGTAPTTFEGRPAVQLSRRSPRRDPARETARIKLAKVIDWLRNP